MFNFRFLNLFLFLSITIVGKVFAPVFPFGNKKISISIPEEYFSCGSEVIDQNGKSFDYSSVDLEEGGEKMLKFFHFSLDEKIKVEANSHIDILIKAIELSGLSIKNQKKENKSFSGYDYSSSFVTFLNKEDEQCIVFLSAYSCNKNLFVVIHFVDLRYTAMTEDQFIKKMKKFESKNIKIF